MDRLEYIKHMYKYHAKSHQKIHPSVIVLNMGDHHPSHEAQVYCMHANQSTIHVEMISKSEFQTECYKLT